MVIKVQFHGYLLNHGVSEIALISSSEIVPDICLYIHLVPDSSPFSDTQEEEGVVVFGNHRDIQSP